MKIISLGNLGQFNNGVNFSSDKMGRGVPLVNVKDITESHRINISNLDLVEMNVGPTLEAKDADLFFVRSSVKREGIGMVAKLRDSNIRAIHCGFVIRFRPTSQEIVSDYLLYLLKSPKYREMVRNLSSGVSIINLSQNNLNTLPITIYPLAVQHKIVDILDAYDDLIDTNRCRIQLLEESARFLFREWFVYFRFPRLRQGYGGRAGHDPIRKSNSNGVKIVDSVPVGWRKRRLVEVADIVMGQSPKSEYYNENGMGLPFHQGVTGFCDRYPTNQIYCTQKNRIAQAGDILFSVRAPVGRINISTEKIIIGRGLSAIRSKDNHQSYLFYELKNHFFKEDMIGGGAIFAAITKKDLENVVVIYPDEKTIEQFESITSPIDMQIEILSKQNQKLAQARDLLLPRLMSGAIEI